LFARHLANAKVKDVHSRMRAAGVSQVWRYGNDALHRLRRSTPKVEEPSRIRFAPHSGSRRDSKYGCSTGTFRARLVLIKLHRDTARLNCGDFLLAKFCRKPLSLHQINIPSRTMDRSIRETNEQ
jgi:hypothetical protein